MEHDPGTEEALRVVQSVVGTAVVEGRVRIDVRYSDGVQGWLIELVLTNSRACPVSLVADRPPMIELFLGPEPTTAALELWRDDRQANLAQLRELLTAIVSGGYEQTVETFERNRVTVVGRFQLRNGEETHQHSGQASAAVKTGEKYTLRFEPY